MNVLANVLDVWFEEVAPLDFYRSIFPEGELDVYGEMNKGMYAGIALEITGQHKEKGRKPLVKRYTVTDDLQVVSDLCKSDNFCVMAPISYAGKSRDSKNARFMYALVVELDNLIVEDDKQVGLLRLISQWDDAMAWIPKPTYLVASGTGLHLYYQFEKPIPLFKNVVSTLQAYKREITKKIWNRHVTVSCTEETIQQESIFQGFRMVGTMTKLGDRVKAYETGPKVSIEYLNSFLLERDKNDKEKLANEIALVYKSNLTKEMAKAKYPEWYEQRIEQGVKKGTWICKPALYEWWLKRIMEEAVVGHRYYCLMMLSIYAIKCGIEEERLINDAFQVMLLFERRTVDEANHFTEKDVLDALQSFYDKDLITYPINSIQHRSGLKIEKNKRNYRKQDLHLKLARATKSILKEAGELQTEGRPSMRTEVIYWRKANPNGTKKQCMKELGIGKSTVYKYWELTENLDK